MRNVLLLFVVILLSGCAAKYNQVDLHTPTSNLIKGKSILIATPENGTYGDKVYSSSGRMTALAVNAAFAKFSNNIEVSKKCNDFKCLKVNESGQFNYYVIPEILHWEDRATEWSGKPDKIEVKVSVYDSETENELASTIIKGKSKWATFGGDHPQNLLTEPLNTYVGSLY
jgi:hypothetical protein